MRRLPPFALDRPASLAEVGALQAAHGPEAALYAGGTELLPLLKEGLVRASVLIDLKRVPGLGDIGAEGDEVVIGATVRHRSVEVSPVILARCPLLAGVARHVANVRVRSVGTVGGNLAFADPHSDLATVLLTLDAGIVLWGPGGERRMSLDAFLRGAYETARADDEVLTAVRLRPWPAGTAAAYVKFGVHERPTLGVAVALTLDVAGRVAEARVAVGCVGPCPRRLDRVEALARDGTVGDLLSRADVLGAAAAEAVDPADDLHGSADYKRDMTRVFVRRALHAAAARARGEEPRASYPYAIVV